MKNDTIQHIKLSEIITIEKGKKASTVFETYDDGLKRYIQIDDLRNNDNLKYTNEESGIEVNENDVIIAWDGANAGTVGFGLKGIIGSTLAKLSINSKLVLPNFLGKYLQTQFSYIRSLCTGATIPHVSKNVLMNIKVPIFPISDQQRIVAILDKADALRQKRKQALALLDELLRSTFLEMFGDPMKNPHNFSIRDLKIAYSKTKEGTKCGPFGSALKKHEYVKKGIPVWTMDNIQGFHFVEENCLYITEEKYKELNKYSVDIGDIIISRAGTVGKMCVAYPSTCPSIISSNLIRLSLDNSVLLPIYFVSLMNYCKNRIQRLKTGDEDAYTYMNTGILNKLKIPFPLIELQTQFAKIVEQTEATKVRMQQSLQELDNQFNALMQRAFKGEL